jgi:hypothetical protein
MEACTSAQHDDRAPHDLSLKTKFATYGFG